MHWVEDNTMESECTTFMASEGPIGGPYSCIVATSFDVQQTRVADIGSSLPLRIRMSWATIYFSHRSAFHTIQFTTMEELQMRVEY